MPSLPSGVTLLSAVSSNVEGHCPLAGGQHVASWLLFQSLHVARASWHQAQSRWARAAGLGAGVARMSWERAVGAVHPRMINPKVSSPSQKSVPMVLAQCPCQRVNTVQGTHVAFATCDTPGGRLIQRAGSRVKLQASRSSHVGIFASGSLSLLVCRVGSC